MEALDGPARTLERERIQLQTGRRYKVMPRSACPRTRRASCRASTGGRTRSASGASSCKTGTALVVSGSRRSGSRFLFSPVESCPSQISVGFAPGVEASACAWAVTGASVLVLIVGCSRIAGTGWQCAAMAGCTGWRRRVCRVNAAVGAGAMSHVDRRETAQRESYICVWEVSQHLSNATPRRLGRSHQHATRST